MSEKQRFQEIVKEIRKDFNHITNLLNVLYEKLEKLPRSEAKNWIYDTFLDKIYETHAKIKHFMEEVGAEKLERYLDNSLESVIGYTESIAFEPYGGYNYWEIKTELDSAIINYYQETENIMSSIRKFMHEVDWKRMKGVKSEDYIVVKERAKFIKARDELENAKQAIKNKKWDDVMNHLRPAIDLAIKEKFGFQKIHPMKQFLQDADKYNFPLPSYTMLYDYFDEGSHRIHGGRINTPWECQKALSFVAEFIDRLELIDVTQKEIEEFKKKCRAVS